MRLMIESTDQVTEIDGVPVRMWFGHTEEGVPCKVFVHRIAVANDQDSGVFDRELLEQLPPARHVSLRNIL